MTDEQKLLPCPFCGCAMLIVNAPTYDNGPEWFNAECTKCSATIEGGYDEQDAISACNFRTPSLDWIVNRAVELGREDDERQHKNIYGQTYWDKEYIKSPEEILEVIKKELGEK